VLLLGNGSNAMLWSIFATVKDCDSAMLVGAYVPSPPKVACVTV
jgi:hypothetical protein